MSEADAKGGAPLHVAPLLAAIAAQAGEADQSRSVSADVIAAIKRNPVMRMTGSAGIGGLDAPVLDVARELEAVAAACGSTAWCLWNHLCVFHLYCGMLGPERIDVLREICTAQHWVSFPGGAGTAIAGVRDGGDVVLNGRASFGSGARYGEWVALTFAMDDADGRQEILFTVVRSNAPGVSVDPTWRAMSLRASATDHIDYRDARVPLSRVVRFGRPTRMVLRRPDTAVVAPRYREDWVGLSDLWLGAMAVGVAQASLDDVAFGIRDRMAIAGTRMVDRPTIHVNLGHAHTRIRAARDTVDAACRETDQRIAAGSVPDEGDYLRQIGASMQALALCDDAMRLLLRVMGGNGLREGTAFERRYRDFQAMPLHINAHADRVSEALGRHLLALPVENAF